MPKKIKNCFYEKLTFEKLMQAHKRARVHKAYKSEIITFEFNLENNITNLLNNIKNKKYHLGKYHEFVIYEPKQRTIKALPYIDRIVHQWYIEEFIKPYFVPKLIFSTFACISDRGTHKAVSQIEKYMRIYKRNYGDFWVLKCDIAKFFYNINPYILFNILKKSIADKELLAFTKLLIFDSRESSESVGIPIGNYTSQFFANIYLNELDQYVKRVLKVKYYVRYMDDFILLLKTKEECKKLKSIIEKFLNDNLKLSLNNKSRYYPYKMGVNFCGYRIFTTHKLLRINSKKKIKKHVKHWNHLYSTGRLNVYNTMQSLNSWLGHTRHCDSFKLQHKILNNCNFLVNDKSYEYVEKDLINLIENDTKKMS